MPLEPAPVAHEPPSPAPGPARRADVEWLRVAGMLLVFLVHAAEPFNPWDTWHIVSPVRSKWLGEVAFFPAPWIMPLFMLLAGESAWFALARRTPGTYVRERLVRIGLPLVAGVLLLVPPQVWLERRLQGRFEGSLLAFYPHFFDEGTYPEGNLSWHHLWFLLFLLVLAIVTLPLFEALRRPAGRRLMARLGAPCAGPVGLAWLVVPVVAFRIVADLVFADVPPIAYDWSGRVLLLPAFVFGFMAAGDPGLRAAVDRHWRSALALALAGSAALAAWAWPGFVLARLPAPRSARAALLWGGYACVGWCWIVAARGGARAHVRGGSGMLSRASELAYPFYVLHHPIIVAVAFVVVQSRLGIPAAFSVVAGASLVATVAACVAVAAQPHARVLFGLRRVARPAVGHA